MKIKPSTQTLLAVSALGAFVCCLLTASGDEKTPLVTPLKVVQPGTAAPPKTPTALRSTASRSTALSCRITAKKQTYRVGDAPVVQVQVRNEGDKAVYLVGRLDGSETYMRFPRCSFEIKNSKGETLKPLMLRCGNTNPLIPADFVKVEPKSDFNPYMGLSGDSGFINFHQMALGEEIFSKPGRYTVQFHYSTQSPKIEDWLGDGKLGQDEKRDAELRNLFPQVPKLAVDSNELAISFVE